ncbi:MAG: glycosyl hydrolase 115 family protein [Nibricoccus sp.]
MLLLGAVSLRAGPWVSEQTSDGSFALAEPGRAAPLLVAKEDFKVVSLAANDLAADIERVAGSKPEVRTASDSLKGDVVLVGTLGKNPWIDALVAEGKLDVTDVRGKWETFLITTAERPLPGVSRALVIVGSDRRGTAFGVYELSQAIGVSPWHWWSDVTPDKKKALHVAAEARRLGPPSVKYRGIFINDEDWGLQPWAAQTFEPENGGIGPKTYGKVFELLLRLKANTLWPAMHACSKPFNADPRNAALADDYAIVMGSSHAEPMLRNNVGEWKDAKEKCNYAINREGVLGYWEERMKTNAKYESVFTLGMRGIHDWGMQGGKTPQEQIALLEQIFADQRALLAKYVRPEVEQVPQMFCAYKEVLGLFRGGLHVPDDVTVVFPDDNFGYIRDFPSVDERGRKGGFGVYYHISYLGRPLSYLWLNTTPPALIWSEMRKAYDHGADRLWIVNVGDIKPGEIGTEFFLRMAWDIDRWNRANLPEFLLEWAAREFGGRHASEIAAIMDEMLPA